MRFALLIFVLSLVLITSGCTRETGNIVINFTDRNLSGQSITIELPGEPEETETNLTENETAGPEEPPEPCEGVVCEDSITTCPDGEAMTCENTCDNETGECTSCIPDCTGHGKETCSLECGDCESLDEDECECVTRLNCEGNGICESGEWPDGGDCSSFDSCDDADDCTLDVFDFNSQSCSYVEICCDDADDCTLDVYNYTTHECQHTFICCSGAEAIIQGAIYDSGTLSLYVNNYGDADLTFDVYLTFENGSIGMPGGEWKADFGELATFTISGVSDKLTEVTIQSRECEGVNDFIGSSWIIGLGEGEEPGDVNITHINETEETVTLEGYGVDMTNWTIEDAALHIYSFPDGFVINGIVFLHTYGNATDSNETNLFWGRGSAVWNNDHDSATLRNGLGEEASSYEY